MTASLLALAIAALSNPTLAQAAPGPVIFDGSCYVAISDEQGNVHRIMETAVAVRAGQEIELYRGEKARYTVSGVTKHLADGKSYNRVEMNIINNKTNGFLAVAQARFQEPKLRVQLSLISINYTDLPSSDNSSAFFCTPH